MKTKLCDLNPVALDKLPGKMEDKSGVGVHYVDAFVKPMNAKLPDGTQVKCKRRGLKVTLTVGTRKGDGLLRRLAAGGVTGGVAADPRVMLPAALQEAATAAGVELAIESDGIYLAVPAAA